MGLGSLFPDREEEGDRWEEGKVAGIETISVPIAQDLSLINTRIITSKLYNVDFFKALVNN